MIDYAYLCQAIADSRAGRRPSGPPPSATPTLSGSGVTSTAPIELYPEVAAEMSAEVDMDSDMVEVDDQQDIPMEAEAEVEVPNEEDVGTPPPDYDATMVYGAGGEMPGQTWETSADADAEPPRQDG